MTPRQRWRRHLPALRRLGVVAVAGTAMLGVLATPALASSGGTINSSGSYVNVRSGPGTNYDIVGTLNQGTGVSVYCTYDQGTAVSGPFGTTKLWDEIGGNRWVTDAFVNTGTNAPIAMPCGGGYGAAFTHGGPEQTDVYAVPGCYFVNTGSGTNFGATSTPSTDWWQYGSGCDASQSYMYTYGNGSSASSDLTTWGYYPGAYATCQIQVQIPYNGGGGMYSFDQYAHYKVLTNKKATVLLDTHYNQQGYQNGTINLGSFQADGTGYLAVTLDDSSGGQSGGGVRVVAQRVGFNCTGSY